MLRFKLQSTIYPTYAAARGSSLWRGTCLGSNIRSCGRGRGGDGWREQEYGQRNSAHGLALMWQLLRDGARVWLSMSLATTSNSSSNRPRGAALLLMPSLPPAATPPAHLQEALHTNQGRQGVDEGEAIGEVKVENAKDCRDRRAREPGGAVREPAGGSSRERAPASGGGSHRHPHGGAAGASPDLLANTMPVAAAMFRRP